jgi:hypothetical protein
MRWNLRFFLSVVLLIGLTVIFFLPALHGEFLHWDDDGLYVYNSYFRGFRAANFQWMCTTVWYGHWQPLTWVSCALDYIVWGMNPRGWHATNLLLHVINSVLVYLLCLAFLKKREGCYVLAALAALFWAGHPLRVEVVVWLATRGYVLCTLFCLLTVLSYLRVAEQKRYPFFVLLCFTLATVTKGIGMMLPLVLLLVDWLPLRRITSIRTAMVCGIEKIPFFALSMLTGTMAFLAKKAGGGMMPVEQYGFVDRFGQAVYGIWFYLLKIILPINLVPLYYKRPEAGPVMIALVLTATMAVAIFLLRRRVRPLLVATGAFLVLIFPMIGFTQSGSQLFADRFTYLSAIPFSVLLAVGLGRLKVLRRMICGAILVLLIIFGAQTFAFSNTWSSNLKLWCRAVSVDQNNAEAHNSKGLSLMDYHQYEKALECFERAIQINPGYVLAWHNRALAKAMTGRYEEAFADWKVVLALPDLPREVHEKVLWIRGWVFEQTGDFKSAENDYSSLADDVMTTLSRRVDILQLRAALYVRMGQKEKALADLNTALKLPDLFGKQHAQVQAEINKINEGGEHGQGWKVNPD